MVCALATSVSLQSSHCSTQILHPNCVLQLSFHTFNLLVPKISVQSLAHILEYAFSVEINLSFTYIILCNCNYDVNIIFKMCTFSTELGIPSLGILSFESTHVKIPNIILNKY